MKENRNFKLGAFFAIIAITMAIFTISISAITQDAGPADTDVNNKASFATDTIYQIITDRFYDGDPSNNPVAPLFDPNDNRKYHGGDWAGIVDQMPYLKGMGISAIWISAPVENLGYIDPSNRSAAYHGYWGHDFFRPNGYFGNLDDFKVLVNTAHENDIKVVIDFAPNHTSTADYPPYDFPEDGALYRDGTLISTLHDDRNGVFNHEPWTDFSTWENCIYHSMYGLSDLNQLNPIIDQYMKDSIKVWLDMGIDGIRVDAVKHMPLGWQKNWVSSVYDYQPVFVFGEWFSGGTGADLEMNEFANQSGMSLLDFRFANATRNAIGTLTGTMGDLHNTILGTAADFKQVNNMVTFIDNHDMSRFMTLANNTSHSVDTAYVIQLTERGVPAIYYGTEQYATGSEDPDNRSDMPSFDTNSNAYKIISKLAPLRKSNAALAYGTYLERWINDDVYVFERYFNGYTVLTAVNRNTSQGYQLDDILTSLPPGTYQDELDGLMGGSPLTVLNGGSVPDYYLGPGVCAVWQFVPVSTAAPVIGNVDPLMSRAGNVVTITGRGFGDTLGTVNFGSYSQVPTEWSDTRITVTVPQNLPAGEYSISVVASGTTSSAYPGFSALTTAQAVLRFKVNNATTALGENVYLLGNVVELGNWDTSKAIGPLFNSTDTIGVYPTWFYDVSVPVGYTIEYKFVKIDSSGNITWEQGANHTYQVPASASEVTVDWQS
ncbi:MAG: IPT/TIG domain-containing protein [Clostridiales bacterium]|jgi:glycosidase|nr:IPT/TIG domain-containing protein [Clostridiales bacterium]